MKTGKFFATLIAGAAVLAGVFAMSTTSVDASVLDINLISNGWYQENGEWCYRDANGTKQYGWLCSGGKWYYLDDDNGYMYKNGVYFIDEKPYIFNKDGVMQNSGWYHYTAHDEDFWVYASSSGALKTGWQNINNMWYWFDDDGTMAQDDVWHIYAEDKYYFFDVNGVWVNTPGWHQSTRYKFWIYIDNSGNIIRNQWKKIGGYWYYFGHWGIAYTNEFYFEDTNGDEDFDVAYYFDNNGHYIFKTSFDLGNWWADKITHVEVGSINVGWNQFGSDWIYVKSGNVLANGWEKCGNKWYFFRNGIMAHDDFVSVYNASTEDYEVYYVDSNGQYVTGWQYIDDGWFYFGVDGKAVEGWMKSGNYWYYLDRAMTIGRCWVYSGGDSKCYFFDENGHMVSNCWQSFVWYDGQTHWMYLGASGKAVQNTWRFIDGKWYYFNNDAIMVTGDYVIDGETYHFSNSGVWQG